MSTPQVRRIAIDRRSSSRPIVRKCFTIDIFEHRLEPQDGYTTNDMIDVVLGTLIFQTVHNEAALSLGSPGKWSEEGSDHPIGVFHRGAIQLIPDYIDPDAEMITIEGSQVIFPGAPAVDVAGLFPKEVFHIHRRGSETDSEAIKDTFAGNPFNEILLGALLEAGPLPHMIDGEEYQAFHDLERIAGRLATLLELGFPSGKMGRDRAMTAASGLCRNMRRLWWMMPDKMRHPSSLVPRPDLLQCVASCDTETVDFGRMVMRNLPSAVTHVSIDAVRTGDDESASNHQRIALKPALDELDMVIEQNAPIHLLKPAARKRRQKRLKASKETA